MEQLKRAFFRGGDDNRNCGTCEHRGYGRASGNFCSKLMENVSPFSKTEWAEIIRQLGLSPENLTEAMRQLELSPETLATTKKQLIFPRGKIVGECPHWVSHRPILPTPEELRMGYIRGME